MRRRLTSLIALAVLATLLSPPALALAGHVAPPKLNAAAATIVTADGVALWSSHSESERRVASTIKMLTALVVREHTQLDDVVTVPRAAEIINDGDAGLVRGQKLTVRQLLNIMLIPSANDAAEALAIHVGGTEKRFVALMNAKAKALGLTHTVAADPHGLGKHEHSTAHDLSVLAHEVLSDRILRAIVRQRSVAVPRVHGKPSIYPSTDLLLGKYGGIEGVKTGFTNPAGYCFVGAAKRGGVELYGVVLGTSSISARFSEMRKLLDWGFAHTHVRRLVSVDTTIGMPVSGEPTAGPVVAHAARSVSIAVIDRGSEVATRAAFQAVHLPVRRGQQLGTVIVSQGKRVLLSVPLIAVANVSARSVRGFSSPPATAPVGAHAGAPAGILWRRMYVAVLGVWRTMSWAQA